MENFKDEKKVAPEGAVNEKELQELADAETPDGGTVAEVTIAVSVALSAGFCPSFKCSSKCK